MALANGKYKGGQLSIMIDSIEYNMDVTSIVLDVEEDDDDDPTFADINTGGAQKWFFQIEAYADYGTGSLWSYVWDNAGDTGVAFIYKLYGGTASATKPHFTGTLEVGAKPGGIGGQAGERFKFERRFEVTGTPTKVVA